MLCIYKSAVYKSCLVWSRLAPHCRPRGLMIKSAMTGCREWMFVRIRIYRIMEDLQDCDDVLHPSPSFPRRRESTGWGGELTWMVMDMHGCRSVLNQDFHDYGGFTGL